MVSSFGRYNYTINFNVLGQYPSDMSCNDTYISGLFDTSDITFVIGAPVHYNNWLYSLLVFIPIGLTLFGFKKENLHAIMLSGILLTVFGVALYANRFPFLNFETDLVTQAFSLMVLAIGLYIVGRTAIEYSKEAAI